MFVVGCTINSASAMLKPHRLISNLSARYLRTITHTNDLENNLPDRIKIYRQQLVEFSKNTTPLDLKNLQSERLKKDGFVMFREHLINPTDSANTIDVKINITRSLLDLQPYLSFVSQEDIIRACNESIMNNISSPRKHVQGTLIFIKTCVYYPFGASSIGYPSIQTGLEKLDERITNDADRELIVKIKKKAISNHAQRLVGAFGGSCGFL